MKTYQEESIFDILPKEIIQSPKKEIYHSRYPPNIHPTGSTFGLHSTSFPEVCNMNGDFSLPRGAHPLKQMYASLGKPDGTNKHDPKYFIRKGHPYKLSPKRNLNIKSAEKLRSSDEVRKPKLPSKDDTPIFGLRSKKNYIVTNAVEVIFSGSFR
jgi:hypothetical protein